MAFWADCSVVSTSAQYADDSPFFWKIKLSNLFQIHFCLFIDFNVSLENIMKVFNPVWIIIEFFLPHQILRMWGWFLAVDNNVAAVQDVIEIIAGRLLKEIFPYIYFMESIGICVLRVVIHEVNYWDIMFVNSVGDMHDNLVY